MIVNGESELLPKTGTPKHSGFMLARRWHLSYNIVAICFTILNIILLSGESIELRLFLGTFPNLTGIYFVLFFTMVSISIGSIIMTILLAWKGQITPFMRDRCWFKYLVITAFFETISSFMIFYSAHSSRVPPPLAAILSQSTIIFTFGFSKLLLKKQYRPLHFYSVGLVLIGVVFSLVPTFKRLHDGKTLSQLVDGWYWPFIYMLAFAPGALMRITQEKLQIRFYEKATARQESITRFSVIYLRTVVLTIQSFLIVLCFGIDILPGFGTSKNVQEWWNSFAAGFSCFFNYHETSTSKCKYTALVGIMLTVSGVVTNSINAFITDHISSNWLAIISTLVPIVSVSFWFSFPSIYRWAGGTSFTTWDIGFNLGALPIIIIGVLVYRKAGTDRKIDEKEDLINEQPHELLW